MKTNDLSLAQVRGVIFGLALFFCITGPAYASDLHKLVQRLFAKQSYILVEYESRPPQLLILSDNTTDTGLSERDRLMQQALLDLSHKDATVREDALLSLADIGPNGITDLIASALADPSADVRDTAASILEDISRD